MGQITGIVSAGIQLGVQAILVKPKRSIGPFKAQATLREVHTDDMEITDQPVEQGSQITDHAFMRPAEVVIECAWSNSPQSKNIIGGLLNAATGTLSGISSILTGNSPSQVRDTYQKMLALQKSREPFDVFTSKRVYKNMLIKRLTTESDRETENLLKLTVELREILIAQVQVVTVGAPASAQANPLSTASPLEKGMKQLQSAGKASLSSAIDSITPDPAKLLFGKLP